MTLSAPIDWAVHAPDHEAGLDAACDLVASLLGQPDGALPGDPSAGPGSELEFRATPTLLELAPGSVPSEVWAIDGGQAWIADARTIAVVAVRGARVMWRADEVVEDAGALEVVVLGGGSERAWLAERGLFVARDTAVDLNLLRDWTEWRLIAETVAQAAPGAIVLVDGDLAPDWRVPPGHRSSVLAQAREVGVAVVGITKHSSLSLGAAPLVSVYEQQGEAAFGPRARWWAEVAIVAEGERSPGMLNPAPAEPTAPLVNVCVARLDPLAPFAFRIDIGGAGDPEQVLGSLTHLSNDAAFPGYPYPLSIVDRLAACSGWVRGDLWGRVRDGLARRGLDQQAIDRAFADRHHLMERS